MQAIIEKQTPLVVGLDPRWESMPAEMTQSLVDPDCNTRAAIFEAFCREIIDVVALLVPAVKPQMAFFEQLGIQGMKALANVTQYAHQRGLVVIMDGKRGDIGSTAAGYALAYLANNPDADWYADSLTVQPYLGADSIDPLVEVCNLKGTGIFVLVKTSNPGSAQFQDLRVEGQPLYHRVAAMVESMACANAAGGRYGLVGAVVGATYPRQLVEMRDAMPHSLLLIPGFGAQGGTAADVAGGFHDDGLGAVVNSSRAIIFAHSRNEFSGEAHWQIAVEKATRLAIDQLAESTPAGRLRR